MERKADMGYRILVTVAILLTLMMIVGQTGALIDYEFTVSIGMQESAEEVTGAGVAWAKGFAFGDTFFYIPLFVLGIAGLMKRKRWGLLPMFGALAITTYWPMVCLSAVFFGKGVISLDPDAYITFMILLPLISAYGLWGMWYLHRNGESLANE